MDSRYSLRFESGERQGEEIPLTGPVFSIGRRPGSSLQILDNSVSGHHADIVVGDQGVLVRDAGSTNGTRVGTERVLEARVAHGDVISAGNVRLVLQDSRFAGAAPPPVAAAEAPEVPERVSANVLLRAAAKKRSPLVAAALVVAVLGAGAAAWFATRTSARAVRAVEPVAGNLLAESYSFESESTEWSPADGAPASFTRSSIPAGKSDERGAAASPLSGSFCLSADLEPGEWALHRSRWLRVASGRTLEARARLSASDSVDARIGLEFAASADETTALVTVWETALVDASTSERALVVTVPPGCDHVRVALRASASGEAGSVDVDDASVVDGAAAGAAPAQLGDHRLFAFGDPPAVAALFALERALITNLEATNDPDQPTLRGVPITVRAGEKGFTLSFGAAARELRLRAHGPLATGIATIGAASSDQGGGYQTHSADFERGVVTSLLLGTGRNRVRIAFPQPVSVRGRAAAAAVEFSASSAEPTTEVELQLDFGTERSEAEALAHAARGAERKDELGECLQSWSALLDRYPFEESLVDEAARARARLIERGLGELRAVEAEIERARFFKIAELFRACRARAQAIAARYRGSEVEAAAATLARALDSELAGAADSGGRSEREKLAAILRWLEQKDARGLAAEVSRALAASDEGTR
ncbi:MAG: FHA domain-containing protein [Planctomycetota bacterium]